MSRLGLQNKVKVDLLSGEKYHGEQTYMKLFSMGFLTVRQN